MMVGHAMPEGSTFEPARYTKTPHQTERGFAGSPEKVFARVADHKAWVSGSRTSATSPSRIRTPRRPAIVVGCGCLGPQLMARRERPLIHIWERGGVLDWYQRRCLVVHEVAVSGRRGSEGGMNGEG